MNQNNKSRLGGLRRIELYGNPGTPEGRNEGGKKTIAMFHNNPSLAKRMGFILRKEIEYPKESSELAEFIGIMLGDGGLSGNHQITISFNNKTDYEYAAYICKTIKRLFSVNCHIHKRRKSNGADIVLNSSNLVDFLISRGLKAGNKVENQVGVPRWVRKHPLYETACMRGLIDTDGGLYYHKYSVKGKVYTYLKLGFGNRSKPLLQFVFKVLKRLGYKVSLGGDNLSISSGLEVKRYFAEIGSSNPKHINKFRDFFGN
ncbi:MAG: LAGLIDADG family homing endonuclease [Candidatus Omnitrophica bacterium]|nr:LAGLIDADG family homing endonuclease [Candidatus Omnitrophota bacterium]